MEGNDEAKCKQRRREARRVVFGVGAALLSARVLLKVGRAALKLNQHENVITKHQHAVEPGHNKTFQDSWQPVASPATPAPPGYSLVASAQLPTSVFNFYHHIMARASTFLQQQHAQLCGHFDLSMGAWTAANGEPSDIGYAFPVLPGSFTRQFTFRNPRSGLSPETRCVQQQQMCIHDDGTLVYGSVQKNLDIPFKDCFTVNSFWEVLPLPGAEPACSVRIYLHVHFLKGCMMRGVIERASTKDCTKFFQGLLTSAAQHLAALPVHDAPQQPGPLRATALGARAGLGPPAKAQAGASSGSALPPSLLLLLVLLLGMISALLAAYIVTHSDLPRISCVIERGSVAVAQRADLSTHDGTEI